MNAAEMIVAALICLIVAVLFVFVVIYEFNAKPVCSAGDGSNYIRLGDWLEEHMPDVYKIGHPDDVRIRLNEITGLDIKGDDEIEETSGQFLEALKKMKE